MILVTTIITQMLPNVTILEAKNGKEALDMAIANHPDLILMDVQMPEMGGIEATVEMRNYEKKENSRIPIIALTAGVIKGEKEKCLEAGMDDFLTKPIEQNALHDVLEKYLVKLHQKSGDTPDMNSPNTDELHFDRIKLMDSIGDNKLVFKELIKETPGQFSGDIARLENAIVEKNMENIKKAAHSIKGAALGMCFEPMAGIAKEIEMSATNHELGNLDLHFKEISLEWEQIQLIIKNVQI
jgi:CheY-like chemotaxis protein/HPt (histidine-containing phosphotransfer) domain-containing protein